MVYFYAFYACISLSTIGEQLAMLQYYHRRSVHDFHRFITINWLKSKKTERRSGISDICGRQKTTGMPIPVKPVYFRYKPLYLSRHGFPSTNPQIIVKLCIAVHYQLSIHMQPYNHAVIFC